MRRKILIFFSMMFVLLLQSRNVFAADAADALLEQQITGSMNSLALAHRDAANQALGYLKGSKITYNVATNTSAPSYDLSLVRYNSGKITIENIDKYLSPDGNFSYYFDRASRTFTIERLKNAPIAYDAAKAATQVTIRYSYEKYNAVISIGGISWFPAGSLNATYTTSVAGPVNFSFEALPEILGDTKEITLSKNDDISSIVLSDYLNVTQHMEGGTFSLEWAKKPDTSMVGEQVAQVKVTDKLEDYVQSKVFDIKVTVKDEKLTAEPNPQITSLGMEPTMFDTSKFVTNVKLGTQTLASDQYTTQFVNTLFTDRIGTQTAKVKVTLKDEPSKTVEVDVPVTINWGNSVVYGGINYSINGRTTAAFTLYPSTIPYIVASQGKNDDNLVIHSSFSNKQYYTFNWFDLSNKQFIKMDESNDGDRFIKAMGNEYKKDKLKEWGINQKQIVNYGDIVRAWQVETNMNWLYENEQQQTYNAGQPAVYYEITPLGYRVLRFNQLTAKSGSIPIYSTKEYLDQRVAEYIDLKGYSNISIIGFSQYPETSVSGQQKGKILIEETLSSTGKKIQFEYEVILDVEPGSLTYSVPQTLTFQEFTKSREEQIIQRKDSERIGLSVKDSRGSNNQGNWTLTAQVKSQTGITPYLIYRNEENTDSYLNGAAVPIYTQEKQMNATEPLEVEVSDTWSNNTGILLKVPAKNNLASQEYSATITWNLVEGP